MERESYRERESGRGLRIGQYGGEEEEGWIPVIRNHRAQNKLRAGNKETFTLYVDNIPEFKDHIWLKKTFNKFGVVRDAFIPHKRSKRTGKKFGFVRYDCPTAAGMAVSRMNGVWVDNERLFVKEACFGHNEEMPRVHHTRVRSELAQRQGVLPKQRASKGVVQENGKTEPPRNFVGHDRSFAQALKGESSKRGDDQKILLHVKPSANGWLHRSAVAIMHRVVSMKSLEVSFSMETNEVALFRSMGGRAVLLTFQSQEIRDELIKGQWMKLWFDNVKPWRVEPGSLERFAWLSCKGVPLDVWNAKTFIQIAKIWGSFIMLDEQTLNDRSFAEGKVLIATEEIQKIDKRIQIEIEGVTYAVLISEISSFVNPDEVEACYPPAMKKGFGSIIPAKPGWKMVTSREKEDDDDVELLKEKTTNRSFGGW
ncbi:hypothetical protein RHMOL_Rhmol03G0014300 [Rhododendron molle]|uniref:Uncharacterized protein n=1 Tax=Rhododendron molle TaxID=49168 RepID=A0ACC0PAJ2_RHOML|nr:hypothetical protein RHMOL_Rhmol03G0014300 [Rhododendron molle]